MSIRRVSLFAVLSDQISKYLVMHYCRMGDSITLVRDYLYLTYIQNKGAAFGFMANTPAYIRIPFFIAITFGAGLIVYAYQRFVPLEKRLQRLALGLIWGGAMGNFIDRVIHGRVVDFIDVRFHQHNWFPYIFNLADSCISVGLTLLLLGYFFGKPKQSWERV